MKYIKNYKKFLNEGIDRNQSIIESEVLKNFSTNFWSISLKSDIFTLEEKEFIKEDLIQYEIDLIQEGLFDFLGKTLDKAKEGGKEILKKITDKITNIKNNIKNVISGICEFLKEFFNKLWKSISEKSKNLITKNKENALKEIDKATSNVDKKILKIELDQIDHLHTFIKSKGDLSKNFSEYFNKKIVPSTVDPNTITNELDSVIKESNVDILKYLLINEGEETPKLSVKEWFFKWVMGLNPEGKKGKMWYVQFILRIITLLLSPLFVVLEVIIKKISAYSLQLVAFFTKKFGGDGTDILPAKNNNYQFVILGGALTSLLTDMGEVFLNYKMAPESISNVLEGIHNILAFLAETLLDSLHIGTIIRVIFYTTFTTNFINMIIDIKSGKDIKDPIAKKIYDNFKTI